MLPEEVFRDFGRAEFAFHLRDLQGVVARGLPRPITHLLCRSGHQNKNVFIIDVLRWMETKKSQDPDDIYFTFILFFYCT